MWIIFFSSILLETVFMQSERDMLHLCVYRHYFVAKTSLVASGEKHPVDSKNIVLNQNTNSSVYMNVPCIK